MSPETSSPLLTIEHLTMKFGGLVAVDDLSFNAKRGHITALIGPNGAGKTTVFNCVTGFYKPSAGRIALTRHDYDPEYTQDLIGLVTRSSRRYIEDSVQSVYLLERMPENEVSAIARVARTFQNIRLFSGMTVLENLLVAQHNALYGKPPGLVELDWRSFMSIAGVLGLPVHRKAEKKAIDIAMHWLERVDLVDRADDAAGDLPYGAQRRLEIARAMCTRPQMLCLDEPAAGLNPRESQELNELLLKIRDEEKISILLIEHDMGVVMGISDHIVVLDYGQKIADGTPQEVRTNPAVIAAYLGVEDEEVERVESEISV